MNEVKNLIDQEIELVSKMNSTLFDYLVINHPQFLRLPEEVKDILAGSLNGCISKIITDLTRAKKLLKEYEAE